MSLIFELTVSRLRYLLFSFFFSSSIRWEKDGESFDPGSDPGLKVTESTGSFAFYTNGNTIEGLKQYQGKYVCYASNELGTAVSNEAVINTEGKSTRRAFKAAAVDLLEDRFVKF